MRILVAGGTGFIGSSIVRELLTVSDYELSVLTRHPDRALKMFGGQVRCLKGDVTDPQSLTSVLSDIDCVIQCVQFPNHPVQNIKKGFTYENYDARGTENLVAAIKNSPVKRIIYLSGAGTRAERTEPWFKAKIRAEGAVKNSGISYVILRPSWVFGPGDQSMSKFVKFAENLPAMPVIGSGKSRVSPIFVDDLSKVVSKSIESEIVKNRVIELGGPQILTMNEIQKIVLEVLGKTKPLIHQPVWLVKLAGQAAELFLSNPPLSSEAVDFITMDIPVESRPAEELYKIKFVDLRTALQSYVK